MVEGYRHLDQSLQKRFLLSRGVEPRCFQLFVALKELPVVKTPDSLLEKLSLRLAERREGSLHEEADLREWNTEQVTGNSTAGKSTQAKFSPDFSLFPVPHSIFPPDLFQHLKISVDGVEGQFQTV